MDRTLRSVPPLFQMWFSKHITGFAGVEKMMHHMKKWDYALCRCCLKVKDTSIINILECQAPELVTYRAKQ